MSEEDDTCPLCIEEIDITDRYFKPCPCGYRICRFCWTSLIEQYDPQCPACRRPYSVLEAQHQPVPPEELERYRSERKRKIKEKKEQTQKEQVAKGQSLKNTKSVTGSRVVQKNVLYITGLPPSISNIDTLRSREYLGQFGKITRVNTSVRGAPYTPLQPHLPNTGLYVFFARREDAIKALDHIDGCHWDSNVVRATYATTKYCTSFLKRQQCRTLNCLYLHRQGEGVEAIYKEELVNSRAREKVRRPLSSVFPAVDDSGYQDQVTLTGRNPTQKAISLSQNFALSAEAVVTQLPQPSLNKKQASVAHVLTNRKYTSSEVSTPADKQRRAANHTVQPDPIPQKQNKGAKVIKTPRQRLKSTLLTNTSAGKIPTTPRIMRSNSYKPPNARPLEDSLDAGAPYNICPPTQLPFKDQFDQISHQKVSEYPAKSFREQLDRLNKPHPQSRAPQQSQNNSYNGSNIPWFTSFQSEAGNVACAPDLATCGTFSPTQTMNLNGQDVASDPDALQDSAGEDGKVQDKKYELTDCADDVQTRPELASSAFLPTESQRPSTNSRIDSADVKDSNTTSSACDRYTGADPHSMQHPDAELEENATADDIGHHDSRFERLDSHDLDNVEDILASANLNMHPIYVGIMDPFSDDIFSMLSSAVVLQGAADQINDNAAYCAAVAEPQHKSRYSGASHKEAFLGSQRQQPATEDTAQPHITVQAPVAQYASSAGQNSTAISSTGGVRSRYPHFLNSSAHRSQSGHYEHDAMLISKDAIFKRNRDDNKNNAPGIQYQACAPPFLSADTEYDLETLQSQRPLDHNKHQGGFDHQDMHFFDPRAQQVSRQGTIVQQLEGDPCAQTSRSQSSSKKQGYVVDPTLQRAPERTLLQQRHGDFHHQQVCRNYHDMFLARPQFRTQDMNPSSSSQPSQKQHAPVDMQNQGDGVFSKVGIHFKDAQKLHMCHVPVSSQYCNPQIQDHPHQHSVNTDECTAPPMRSDVQRSFFKLKGDPIGHPRIPFQNSSESQHYDGVNRGPVRFDAQDTRIPACTSEWHNGNQRIPMGTFLKSTHSPGDAPS